MTPWLRPAKGDVDPKTGRPNADERDCRDNTAPWTAIGAVTVVALTLIGGYLVANRITGAPAVGPTLETRGRLVRSVLVLFGGTAHTRSHYHVTVQSGKGELIGEHGYALRAGLPVVVRYRSTRSGAPVVESIRPAGNPVEPRMKPDLTSGE